MFCGQFEAAKNEAAEAVARLKDLETQLMATRERCERQAQELVNKSSKLQE
jgi:hypothetical protein